MTHPTASPQIDEQRLVRTLVDLIEIPSVNPFGAAILDEGRGERAAADYVAARLSRLGWQVEVREYAPGRANIIGRSPHRGERKPVVLAGHLDTVEVDGYHRPFEGAVRDGRVYGRGACDMKAAIAAYIEVAEALAGTELAGPLIIAGVGDEEFHQEGAKASKLPEAELVVIGEPTELKICTAAKGLAAYTLSVEGRATHGSVPHAGDNAIFTAAELMSPLKQHAEALREVAHPLLGPGVLNVGVIRGGLKPNIVPSRCDVEISRRLLPGETPQSAHASLLAELNRAAKKESWTLSDAWWTVDPYENLDQNCIGHFQRAASSAGLSDVSLTGFPASSDAAYFGSPVVIFGPGSLDQAHSLDEWVRVEEMTTAAQIYLRYAMDRLAPGAA